MKHHLYLKAGMPVILALTQFIVAGQIPAQSPSDSNVKIRYAPITRTSPGDGQKMYEQYCAVCHGLNGRGNGPAAPGVAAPPMDLVDVPRSRIRNVLDDNIAWRVHEKAGMPYWYDSFRWLDKGDSAGLSDMRVTALVSYVKRLQSARAPIAISQK